MSPPVSGGGGNAACAPQHHTPPFSFPGKKTGGVTVQKKGVCIASEQLEELQCLPIALPIARRCRVSTARRFASAPTPRCRSAHLVEVQPNFRLPPVSTMRRASAMPHSVGSLPPSKRHSRLTIVRRGCKRSRLAEIHGEAMYTAPDCAARAALQAANPQCWGSRGTPLAFLLGIQRGYSLRKENTPFGAAARTPLPLPRSRGKIRAPLWKRV